MSIRSARELGAISSDGVDVNEIQYLRPSTCYMTKVGKV